MKGLNLANHRLHEGNRRPDLGERKEPRAQAVVDVVRVIGDVVGDRRRLRFEARVKAEIERVDPVVAGDRFGNAARAGPAGPQRRAEDHCA